VNDFVSWEIKNLNGKNDPLLRDIILYLYYDGSEELSNIVISYLANESTIYLVIT